MYIYICIPPSSLGAVAAQPVSDALVLLVLHVAAALTVVNLLVILNVVDLLAPIDEADDCFCLILILKNRSLQLCWIRWSRETITQLVHSMACCQNEQAQANLDALQCSSTRR